MLPIVAKYFLGWIANDAPSENWKKQEKRKRKHPYLLTYIESVQGTSEYYTIPIGMGLWYTVYTP